MLIKICGVSTKPALDAAIAAGADLVGLVFHPRSPRYVIPETAAGLVRHAGGRVATVALVVDMATSAAATLCKAVRPDLFQLHGRETPGDVAAIAQVTGAPVIKAIGVSTSADLAVIGAYAGLAAHVLLDAKPPADAAYTGGHGRTFDWSVLTTMDRQQPFLLSGGLTPENVAGAISSLRSAGLNLTGVDVSSGVESAPGVKDVHKIRDFIQAARAAG